jgi:hypothetical protein
MYITGEAPCTNCQWYITDVPLTGVEFTDENGVRHWPIVRGTKCPSCGKELLDIIKYPIDTHAIELSQLKIDIKEFTPH